MSSRSNDDISGLRLLGKGSAAAPAEGPSADLLEAFPNRYPQRDYIIQLSFPEFTSLCPVTGQPDFGVICLEYIPDLICVESKSFKLYMFAFRNHQSFMETITNRILEDFDQFLKPRWISVKGLFAPRGATKINVFAENYKKTERISEIRETVANWRQGRGN